MNDPNLYRRQYFVVTWLAPTEYYVNGICMTGSDPQDQILIADSEAHAVNVVMAAHPNASCFSARTVYV